MSPLVLYLVVLAALIAGKDAANFNTLRCSKISESIECDSSYKYRTLDGSCNNLEPEHNWWGKAWTPYQRLLKAEYDDGREAPRSRSKVTGRPLPNPRNVSLALHYPVNEPASSVNHLFAIFGQFIAQDLAITKKPEKQNECPCGAYDIKNCVNINTLPNDRINQDQVCMTVPRSDWANHFFPCKFKSREQINTATHWLDLSNVYGSDEARSQQLRRKKDGLLKSDRSNDFYQEYFTQDQAGGGGCRDEAPKRACFLTGSPQSNQNLLLTSVSTLWLREHNRIAKELKNLYKDWSDEKLFQEARRINIAQYQKIVYADWLPLVLGRDLASRYGLDLRSSGFTKVYKPKKNPQIFLEFSTAAFRFGHSLLQTWIQKADSDLRPTSNLTLGKVIYRPVEAYVDGGLDALFRGMLVDPAQKADAAITEAMEDHLFDYGRLDSETLRYSIGALNVNAGRDHGLTDYNRYRRLCGLPTAKTFDDLTQIRAKKVAELSEIYGDVNDIDLFTGGLIETPLNGSMIGPTFSCLISLVFKNLKLTDRFYFENESNGLSLAQLDAIRFISLKSIICSNIELAAIGPDPFQPSSVKSKLVDCAGTTKLDLTLWLI